MGAKKAPLPIVEDFNLVVRFFQVKGVLPDEPDAVILDYGRRIHGVTYSLIWWRFRLRGLKQCGKVFIEELASDALQILPQAFMGYNKASKLLIRGVIENVWRHLYFSDHPVEFQKMNSDKKWYIRTSELKEYVIKHPLYLKTECKFDAGNRLNGLYAELSAGVHGGQVADLEMRVALDKIAADRGSMKTQATLAVKCAESVNFLLAAFHREQFFRFHREDRQIVLRTMPSAARRTLLELE